MPQKRYWLWAKRSARKAIGGEAGHQLPPVQDLQTAGIG